MGGSKSWSAVVGAAIVFVGIFGGAPAQAQQLMTSPQAVAECLCLAQRVEQNMADLRARQQAFEQARAEVQRLEQQTETDRGRVRTDDAASVEAFRQLLQRYEDRRTEFNRSTLPAYNTAVAEYSSLSGQYSAQCAGKSYDGATLQSVRSTLVCPRT